MRRAEKIPVEESEVLIILPRRMRFGMDAGKFRFFFCPR